MGGSNSKKTNSALRLIPREPVQERIYVPDEEPDYPLARVPGSSKKDIYNPNENRDIYFHALKASKDLDESWDDLMTYLTSIYRNDMMKVRSIFAWLGTQDIEDESYFFVTSPDSLEESTPRGYKKLIKKRQGSYATMFTIMCRKAGIKCAIVNGLSKGYGYEVGETNYEHLRDRWVAVYIDGWRLIHPLWAYKSVISYKYGKWVPPEDIKDQVKLADVTDEYGVIKHDFNEYYFIVDPSELITVCYPDKDKWQLMNAYMPFKRWTEIPHLQKRYHMDGFKLTSQFKSVLTATKAVAGLHIKQPSTKNVDYQLAYDFCYCFGSSRPEIEEPIILSKYVLMSRDSAEKRWNFELRMPIPGKYRVTVYGGPSTQRKLPWICDVGILCDEPVKSVKPYPDTPKIGYGPVDMTTRLGLTDPSHPNGVLFVKPRQTVHITFKLTKTISAKADIIGEGIPDNEKDKWVQTTINNQSALQILDVVVTLLKEGEYAVKIFTKPRDSKVPFKNTCNYYMSTDPPRDSGVVVKDKGYKTAKEINTRKALDEAYKGKNLFELKEAIQQFEKHGLHEVDGSFGKASQKMDYLEMVKELKDAVQRRNIDLLNKAIRRAEQSDYRHKVEVLLHSARTERDHLLEMKKFMHDILEMKQSTISEMTSYLKPPPAVHDTLVATLLLLGIDKEKIETWDKLKVAMKGTGKDNILRQVREFDSTKVSYKTAEDVNVLLAAIDEDSVRGASAGAGTFYQWAKSMVDEIQKKQSTENMF